MISQWVGGECTTENGSRDNVSVGAFPFLYCENGVLVCFPRDECA